MPEVRYAYKDVVRIDVAVLVVNEVEITNAREINLNRITTEGTTIFSATISNAGGLMTNAFAIDDAVEIYFADNLNQSIPVFSGVIDSIDNSNYSKIVITGKDYASKLQDRLVNETYTNREVSDIITNASDGLVRYFSEFGIDTYHVGVTTVTLDLIKFVNKTTYECLKELAEQTQYDFYVDVDKSLHFQPKGTISSGQVLDSGIGGNIIEYSYLNDIKTSYNQVTVVGANIFYKDFTDTKTGDGSTTIFTLTHAPDAPMTEVKVGGVTKTENTDFAVDYNIAKITFVTAPAGAAAITIKYNYTKPIIGIRRNADSIANNNIHEKFMSDKNILTTERANTVAQGYLALYSDPKVLLKIKTRGFTMSNVPVGTTVQVTIPRAGLNNATYTVIEENFLYGIGGFTCESIIATADISFAEILKQVLRDVRELKLRDSPNAQLVATLIDQTFALAQTITVTTRDLNSSFAYDTTTNSEWDSTYAYDDQGTAFA